MANPVINLVLLKAYVTDEPSVFDDTAHSVQHYLKLAGFDTRLSCNMIYPDALNIIWGVGAHGAPPLEEIRKVARPEFSIIFNMEQISSSSALVSEEYQQLISEYRVLDYSQHNVAALLARFPNMRCQEFPLLPKPLFAGDFAVDWAPAEPRPDVAFWGVLNDRRKALLHTLQLQGRSVQLVSRNYGKNLSAAIARTRLCLNVHYYDSAIFELARCLRPLAMGMPIVPKCRACRAWSTGGKAASSSASMTTWPPVAASCWSSRNWRRTRCAKPSTS